MRCSARSVFLFPVLTAGLLVGCDEQPTPPASEVDEFQPTFSHGRDGSASATARWISINASGVHGAVAIIDDGSQTLVSGLAIGLDPNNSDGYSSLFYDRASQLSGPEACEPGKNVGIGTSHPQSLTFAEMTIGNFGTGEWVVNADGTASLGPFATADYVSVDRVGTISIRDLSVQGPFGPGTGPAAVVACGRVTTN